MQICKKTGGGTMEVSKIQRTTLTMKEASEYLGISYWLINQLVRKNKFHIVKLVENIYLEYKH